MNQPPPPCSRVRMAYGLRSAVIALLLMNADCLVAYGQGGCCFSQPKPGLLQAIEESTFYFKAERISTSVRVEDETEYFFTTFEVTEILKTPGNSPKVGHRFESVDGSNALNPSATEEQKSIIPQRGTSVLFVSDGKDFAVEGRILCETNDAVTAYLASTAAAIAKLTEKDDRRKIFVPYLCHPESVIAEDAITEISARSFHGVHSLIQDLPHKRVIEAFSSSKTDQRWLGHYGLLLGMFGRAEDADLLEKKIVELDSDFRLGIEGVVAGYLLIRGEEGLEVIEESKMRLRTGTNSKGEEDPLPFSETYAAMEAIRFLWTYEPHQIPRERLRESMRLLLDRPELADLAINDLTKMKDWASQERIIAMFDEERFDIPAIKRAIVRYLYRSADVKDKGDLESEQSAERSVRAVKALEDIRNKAPKLYDDATRYLTR